MTAYDFKVNKQPLHQYKNTRRLLEVLKCSSTPKSVDFSSIVKGSFGDVVLVPCFLNPVKPAQEVEEL